MHTHTWCDGCCWRASRCNCLPLLLAVRGLSVCIYVCVHTHTHTHTHVCVCVCVCMIVHMCVCAYLYAMFIFINRFQPRPKSIIDLDQRVCAAYRSVRRPYIEFVGWCMYAFARGEHSPSASSTLSPGTLPERGGEGGEGGSSVCVCACVCACVCVQALGTLRRF